MAKQKATEYDFSDILTPKEEYDFSEILAPKVKPDPNSEFSPEKITPLSLKMEEYEQTYDPVGALGRAMGAQMKDRFKQPEQPEVTPESVSSGEGIVAPLVRQVQQALNPFNIAYRQAEPQREKVAFELPEITATAPAPEQLDVSPKAAALRAQAIRSRTDRPISKGYERSFNPAEAGDLYILPRIAKDVAGGGLAVLSGLSSAAEWTGLPAEQATKKIEEWQKALAPTNPNFIDEVFQGAGSMLVFAPIGLGSAMTVGKMIGRLSPKVASGIASGVAGLVESAAEAGSTWNEVNKASGRVAADDAARRTFLLNALVNPVLNRMGVFGDRANGVRKALMSAPPEGIQEAYQEFVQNLNTGKPLDENVLKSGAIGAIIGAGGGFVVPQVGQESRSGLPGTTGREFADIPTDTKTEGLDFSDILGAPDKDVVQGEATSDKNVVTPEKKPSESSVEAPQSEELAPEGTQTPPEKETPQIANLEEAKKLTEIETDAGLREADEPLTREQKRALIDAGFTVKELKKMPPKEAKKVLGEEEVAPAARTEQPGDEAAEEVVKTGQVDVPKRVSIAGAKFDVVERNADGTYKVRNDMGDVFDTTPNEDVVPIDVVGREPAKEEKLPATREEYVQRELDNMRQLRESKLREAVSRIEREYQPSKPLPVGLSKVQSLLTKERKSKAEKALAAAYRVAKQDLEADTRADALHHGRVYDELKRRSQPVQEKRTEEKVEQPAEQPAKQAWEMTREEFVDEYSRRNATTPSGYERKMTPGMIESFRDNHRIAVEDALSEGKTVPPEVLKDYPDLAKKKGEPTATPKTPKGEQKKSGGKEAPAPLTQSKLEEAAEAAPKAGLTLKEQKKTLLDELKGARDAIINASEVKWDEVVANWGGDVDKLTAQFSGLVTDKTKKAVADAGFKLTKDGNRLVSKIPGDGVFYTSLSSLIEKIDLVEKRFPTSDKPKASELPQRQRESGALSNADKIARQSNIGRLRLQRDYDEAVGNLREAERTKNRKAVETFTEQVAEAQKELLFFDEKTFPQIVRDEAKRVLDEGEASITLVKNGYEAEYGGKKVKFDSEDSAEDWIEDQIRKELEIEQGKQQPPDALRQLSEEHTSSENFQNWFEGSKVVDENGKPKMVFSGHANVEVYGTQFNPKKGTAGAFYATESPEIASNYALGKLGDKQYFENGEQYRLQAKNGKFTKKLWQVELTEEQKKKWDELAEEKNEYGDPKYDSLHNYMRWARDNKDYEPLARRILANPYNLQNLWAFNEEMGYNVAYPKQETEAREPYYMRQQKNDTEDVMDALGIRWQSFDWAQPGVLPIFLNIKNPIDTTKPFPKDVLRALEGAARGTRYLSEQEISSRHWTGDYPLRNWIADIKKQDETGEDTYWATQVPKKALPILKRFGYDGIKDIGGKARPDPHTVWIVFDPTQVKSATGNNGQFDPTNADMLKKVAEQESAIQSQDVDSLLSALTPEARENVVVTTRDNAPEGLRKFLDNKTKGIYYNGKVYLFENADPKTFFHELAHMVIDKDPRNFLRGMFGEDHVAPFLDSVWRDRERAIKNAEWYNRYTRTDPDVYNPNTAQGKRNLANEYIAHLSENQDRTTWEKLIAWLRSALRNIAPNIEWTDAELKKLIADGYRKMQKTPQKGTAVQQAPIFQTDKPLFQLKDRKFVAVGIKIGDKVYRGNRGEIHADLLPRMTQDEQFKYLDNTDSHNKLDGFIDDAGQFVSRQEASREAKKELASPDVLRQIEGKITDTPAFKKWFGDSKVVDENGEPLVVYHSTHANFDTFDKSKLKGGSFGFHVGTVEQADNVRLTGGTSEDLNKVRPVEGMSVMPLYVSIQNPLRMTDKGTWYAHDLVERLVDKGIADNTPLPENARTLAGYSDNQHRLTWGRKSDARKRLDIVHQRAINKYLNEHPDAGYYDAFSSAVLADNNYISGLIEAAGYDGIVYDNEYEGGGDSWIAFHPTQIKSATGNRGTFDPTDPNILRQIEGDEETRDIEGMKGKRGSAKESPKKQTPQAEGRDEERIVKAAYAKDEIPNGWFVHGRKGSDQLASGYIELSNSLDTANDYGAKGNGSVWYVKPKSNAKVIDFRQQAERDKLLDLLIEKYNDGTLPFKDEITWRDNETGEDFRYLEIDKNNEEAVEPFLKWVEAFNPEDIRQDAGAYDRTDVVDWLEENTGAQFVITNDGAVAIEPKSTIQIRVFNKGKIEPFDQARAPEGGAQPRKGQDDETALRQLTEESDSEGKVEFNALPREAQADIASWLRENEPAFAGYWNSDAVLDELAGIVPQMKVKIVSIDPKSIFSKTRSISPLAVKNYAALKSTAPPVIIRDGKLLEGGHRVSAAIKRGDTAIQAVDISGIDWNRYVNDPTYTGEEDAPLRQLTESDSETLSRLKPIIEATGGYNVRVDSQMGRPVVYFEHKGVKDAEGKSVPTTFARFPETVDTPEKINAIVEEKNADYQVLRQLVDVPLAQRVGEVLDALVSQAEGEATGVGKERMEFVNNRVSQLIGEYGDFKALDPELRNDVKERFANLAKYKYNLNLSFGEEQVTGLNLSEQDRIRKHTGLEELPPADKRKWETVLEEAKTRGMDAEALTIAREALHSNRSLTDVEHAGLVLKAAQLTNRYDELIQEASRLIEKGDVAAATQIRKQAETVIEELDLLTDGARLARRETARALSIGRMMVTQSYELAPVIQRAQVAKGEKLTPEESAKFEKLVSDYKALEAKLRAAEENYAKAVEERDRALAKSETVRRASKRERDKEKIQRTREDIKKRLRDMGLRVNDVTGVTAEASYLIGRLAINYIHEGAVTLDEVVQKVRADMPDLTDQDVYRAINATSPREINRARTEVQKRVGAIKQQARLLDAIEKAERGVFESKKPSETLPEIRALQKRLRDLRLQAYRSGTEQLERALAVLAEAQDQLDNHYRKVKQRREALPEEVAAIRKKIATVRALMRTEDTLADLNEQLRTNDFKIKQRVRREVDPQLERSQIELKRKKAEIQRAIEQLQPMSAGKVAIEVVNILRTVKATADMSATLRQGLVLSTRHPVVALRAFTRSFHALFSDYTAEQVDNAIRTSPNQFLRDKAKLFLAELDSTPSKREEHFMSNLIDKVPAYRQVVRASNRSMVTTLNLLRVAAFDEFVARYPNATQEELEAWANWVNVASGRGDLGKFTNAANVLSLGLFAPRFAVSRIQTPFMVLRYWQQPRVRKEIAKNYAALGAVGMVALSLAALAGADVEDDPRSPDWGKIKIGNTRFDIWGGLQQPARVVVRIGAGLTDKMGLTGEELSDRQKDIDPLDFLGRFAAYKLAPAITLPKELYTGKTIVGEEVTPGETIAKAFMPLIFDDVYDAYKHDGAGTAIASGAATFLGVGTGSYVKDAIRELERRVEGLKAKAVRTGSQPDIDAYTAAKRVLDDMRKASPEYQAKLRVEKDQREARERTLRSGIR